MGGHKKWNAHLKHKGKEYYGGYSDNEEHAAMKVNLLCDKYELERKNPTINTKPNAIQQNTNFIMYQYKPKNIEDENILGEFKDEYQNRFMKSNEDTLLQNHTNTKR